MKFRVLKPLSSKHDDRIYKPGEIFDDEGRLTAYEIELLQAMSVVVPLTDEPDAEKEK